MQAKGSTPCLVQMHVEDAVPLCGTLPFWQDVDCWSPRFDAFWQKAFFISGKLKVNGCHVEFLRF